MNYFFPIRRHHPSQSIFSPSGRFQEPQIGIRAIKQSEARLSKWITVNKNIRIILV
jgi:hypothetical protein